MLTIQNYKTIEGIQIHIKGYTFTITEVKEHSRMYIFRIEYKGTVLAPFTVSLSRFSEHISFEYYKYIFRKNGENASYVYLIDLKTKTDFVHSLTNYLNHI